MTIEIGSKVRHVSGAWACGCNEAGEVTKLSDGTELDEDEPMAFVGTTCGWQWLPISELGEVVNAADYHWTVKGVEAPTEEQRARRELPTIRIEGHRKDVH